jgi:3-hydroxymyristoyl/3-hydroxydecanoyl-(acyl carrier protein) dehydratase
MPDESLDAAALTAFLPHRGMNLMPDHVWLSADRTKAKSRTRIMPGDARGREGFGRRSDDNMPYWYEPMLGELMALTGIALQHQQLASAGRIGVFSMIANLVIHSLAPLYGEVLGRADITRDRGSFTMYSTSAEIEGKPLLSAEVMSASLLTSDIANIPAISSEIDDRGEPIDPTWLSWKPEHLRFAQRLVASDAAAGTVTVAFRYPATHPFVPGHFPNAPVMMGVTQWAAIADAAVVAARRFGMSGTIIANGALTRPNGEEVVDVRDLVLENVGTPAVRIARTKRIAFRGMVAPESTLLSTVTVKSG